IQTLYKIGQKNPAYIEMAAPELRAAMSDEDEMVRKNAADAYSLIGDIESQRGEVNVAVHEADISPGPASIRQEFEHEPIAKPIAKPMHKTVSTPIHTEQPQVPAERVASPERYSISLRIMNKGRPLANARIVLTDDAGRIYEIQTSNIGVATASVPSGEYNCLIEHGNRAMTQHLDVTENRSFIFQFENHVNVIITDEMTSMPLEGATVEIRSEELGIHKSAVSDSAGVASFDDFEADTILVSVQYIGYESVQLTSTYRDISISIHAEVIHETQSATMSDEMLHSIATLRSEASRYTDHLPHSCDLCIPQYLQNICLAALDITQRATSDNEQFIKASTLLCEGIEQSMMEGRLADICIGKKAEGFDTKSCEVNIASYFNKLGKISEFTYNDVEKRLFDVDSLITKNMSSINIIPVVGVWKIAKKLLDASHNEPQPDAFLFFADLVLDRVTDMMDNPDILKLLAQ
ncbi:MAG: carboxypeptidase regulatory-like domain-containing protein, partial [Methanosarcinales archaeon]|nr:carboxypeptidase regulatory-like domain-containing protein [Methanosarcinales archaeon]